MFRADHFTADATANGLGKPGYTEGDPGVTAATVVTGDALNAFQEEIANVCDDNSVDLLKTNQTQLLQSIRMMRVVDCVNNLYGVDTGGLPTYFGICFDTTLGLVAVGSAALIKSAVGYQVDLEPGYGGTWTSRTAGGGFAGNLNGVAVGASIFVAVGDTGEIQSSPTGATWTHRTAAASYAGNFSAVTFGNSLFVAVGATGEIQTSSNGTSWTHRSPGSGYAGTFFDVLWDGNHSLFVAVGSVGEIQTSPDGITWTRRNNGGVDITRVGTDGFGHFLAGRDAAALYSANGTTWTTGPTVASSGSAGAVVFVGPSAIKGTWIMLRQSSREACFTTQPPAANFRTGSAFTAQTPYRAIIVYDRVVVAMDGGIYASPRYTA